MSLRIFSLVLGPYQTNCYLVAREGLDDAVVIDPGDEPQRVLAALEHENLRTAAVLVTHGHIDHIGAVRAVAEAAGCEVWMARGDADRLRELEGAAYEPEHLVDGGQTIDLAGISFITYDVPGHTGGSVAFAADGVVFVGDVLFAGGVGRTDFEGGDWATLQRSIELLMRSLPPETVVLSGHGPATTLGQELAVNPFLEELRS